MEESEEETSLNLQNVKVFCVNCNTVLESENAMSKIFRRGEFVTGEGVRDGDEGREGEGTNCSRREVSLLQALVIVFKLDSMMTLMTFDDGDSDLYYACRSCGSLLETAYNAIEDFKFLTKCEGILSSRFGGSWRDPQDLSGRTEESEDSQEEETELKPGKICGSRSPVKKHKCQPCNKSFSTEALLKKHSKLIHSPRKMGKPQQCPLMKHSRRRKLTEEQSVSEDDTEKDNDSKLFTSPVKLKEGGGKGRKAEYKCNVCGKLFLRPDHLQHHVRTHSREKPFSCDHCGKAFTDPRGLAFHEITHSNERPYCCTICGQTFKRRHHLIDHEANHRDIPRPFKCTLCGKAFKYKKHLNSHAISHRETKEFKCDICLKAFSRKDNLQQHVKKLHENSTDKHNDRRRDTIKLLHADADDGDASAAVIGRLSQAKIIETKQIFLSIPNPDPSTGATNSGAHATTITPTPGQGGDGDNAIVPATSIPTIVTIPDLGHAAYIQL